MSQIKGKIASFSMLYILILIFFITRLILILFGNSEIFDDSELFRGTIAKEIIQGRSWPLLAYQNEPHEGGSLVVGILAVPFFYIFGESLISLKLVALLFSLSTLIVLYMLLSRYFDETIALTSSLLYIFSPPFIFIYSTMALGTHQESMLISLLTIFLFWQLFFIKDGCTKRNFGAALIFGAICGFGVYFSYSFLIALTACLIFWFIIDKLFFLKGRFIYFLIAFILGSAPLFLYAIQYGFLGMQIHHSNLLSHFSLSYFFTRAKTLLFDYLPKGFALVYYKNKISLSIYLNSLFSISFLCSFFGILYLNRRSLAELLKNIFLTGNSNVTEKDFLKEAFVSSYVIIFFLAYVLSDFKSSSLENDLLRFKYLALLYPFSCIVISIFISRIADKFFTSQRKPIIAAIVIVLSIPFFVNFIRLTSFSNFTQHINRYKGYSYELMGCNVIKFNRNIPDMLHFVNRINEEYRHYAYRGFANDLSLRYPPEVYIPLSAQIDNRYNRYFYQGIGMGVAEKNMGRNYPLVLEAIDVIDSSYRHYYFEGIGIIAAINDKNFIHGISKENLYHYHKGLGIGFMWRYRADLKKVFEMCDNIAPEYREAYYQGLKEGLHFEEYYNFDSAEFYKLYVEHYSKHKIN